MTYQTKNPLFVGAKQGVKTTYLKQTHHNAKLLSKCTHFKKFLRERLPNAHDYYVQQFPILKTVNQRNWVSVLCCFHEDRLPSLRINLISGAFRCFACGAKGGDVLAFHQQRYDLTFKQAVNFFNAWDSA